MGHGTKTCGEMLQEIGRSPVVEESYATWALGFFSGINFAVNRSTQQPVMVGKDVSNDTLIAMLKQRCATAPMDKVIRAAEGVYFEAAARR